MGADLCSVKVADIDVSVKGTTIVELGTGRDDDEDSKVADIDVSMEGTSIVELGTEGDDDENSMVEALVMREVSSAAFSADGASASTASCELPAHCVDDIISAEPAG